MSTGLMSIPPHLQLFFTAKAFWSSNLYPAKVRLREAITENRGQLSAIANITNMLRDVPGLLSEIAEQLSAMRSRHALEEVPSPQEQAAIDPEKECSICLEEKCDFTTVCCHIFHQECIKKHYNSTEFTTDCPNCRALIIEEDFEERPYVHDENTQEAWVVSHDAMENALTAMADCSVWKDSTHSRCRTIMENPLGLYQEGDVFKDFFTDCFSDEPLQELRTTCGIVYEKWHRFRGLRGGFSLEQVDNVFNSEM